MSLLDIWNWITEKWNATKDALYEFWVWLISADLLVGLKYILFVIVLMWVAKYFLKCWENYNQKLIWLYENRPKIMYGLYLVIFGILAITILLFIVGLLVGFSFVANLTIFLSGFTFFMLLAIITKPKGQENS
jgi:hypothetical protein